MPAALYILRTAATGPAEQASTACCGSGWGTRTVHVEVLRVGRQAPDRGRVEGAWVEVAVPARLEIQRAKHMSKPCQTHIGQRMLTHQHWRIPAK
jgi:hypothetical protein